MSRTLTFEVQSDGQRLDRFLAERCPDISRSRLQRLIDDGYVTLEDASAKQAYRLRKGQTVTLTIPDPRPSHLTPQNIPVSVVYQDRDILVIDKPSGLTVHAAPGHPDRTLVNALLALCPDLQGIGGTIRPGIVHRLDKDSSGLLVVAKNETAHNFVSKQFKDRQVKKHYIALVVGHLASAEAVIDAPIGRDPRNRKRMSRAFGEWPWCQAVESPLRDIERSDATNDVLWWKCSPARVAPTRYGYTSRRLGIPWWAMPFMARRIQTLAGTFCMQICLGFDCHHRENTESSSPNCRASFRIF